MESSPSNIMECYSNLNCCTLSVWRPADHESLGENAHLREQEAAETEHHSLLNSFSLRHLPPSFPPSSRDFASLHLADSLDHDRLDPAFPYLGLSRGISENYEYFEEESSHMRVPCGALEPPSLPRSAQQSEEARPAVISSGPPSPLFLPISEQELKSEQKNEDLSESESAEEGAGRAACPVGLKVTKNVTKNIGKLLFKFIWKHRRSLGQELRVERSQWECFMKVIALWKRQNNITRQYLMRRWHGEGEHCALFRRLSRHFFRIRCLPAVMKSHIRLKRVHYERIYRFSAAITDPQALASLA